MADLAVLALMGLQGTAQTLQQGAHLGIFNPLATVQRTKQPIEGITAQLQRFHRAGLGERQPAACGLGLAKLLQQSNSTVAGLKRQRLGHTPFKSGAGLGAKASGAAAAAHEILREDSSLKPNSLCGLGHSTALPSHHPSQGNGLIAMTDKQVVIAELEGLAIQ